MRTMTLTLTVLTVLIAAALASAETDTAAQRVVSSVAAQVEADLAGVTASAPAAVPGSFDPIARAQARMTDWTRLPEPPARPPVVTVTGPGRMVVSGPDARGLTSERFARLGTTLTFPASAETARAIRRMAQGQVSAIPNRCAGTLREALGWGLGDAHQWTGLPKRGYHERPRGSAAQPGDIVVWPFTFGRRNSQHVGIAVGTPSGTRLLSNLSGDLGLSSLVPGYRAYWR